MNALEKQLPTGGTIPMGKGGEAIKTLEFASDDSTRTPPLSRPRRRLEPKAGALIKLDIVETRLQAARAVKDDDAWGRYYQSWLKLHVVAFGYGGAR